MAVFLYILYNKKKYIESGQIMTEKQINPTFRIFSSICIILVVAGHADFHIFDFGGMFPYYSFHVMAFLFISGYFYREESENDIPSYIKRKFRRLMLPYFVWNLFYGLLAAALHRLGFEIGEPVGFKTLLLDPFLNGHQFGYNYAAWFVPALFLIQILNIIMRKLLGFLHLKKEWLITTACFLAGIFTVWLSIHGHVWGYYKFPGRIFFMFPAYQFGYLYRKKLEKYDTLPNGIYFSILFIIQLILVMNCNGLSYSAVWCTGFANSPWIPYITAITGTAFWLRISKILEPLYGNLKYIRLIGENTYAVMVHHVLGFFLLNGCLYAISLFYTWAEAFDQTAFFTDIGYLYFPGNTHAFKWVYLLTGLGFSLFIQRVTRKLPLS